MDSSILWLVVYTWYPLVLANILLPAAPAEEDKGYAHILSLSVTSPLMANLEAYQKSHHSLILFFPGGIEYCDLREDPSLSQAENPQNWQHHLQALPAYLGNVRLLVNPLNIYPLLKNIDPQEFGVTLITLLSNTLEKSHIHVTSQQQKTSVMLANSFDGIQALEHNASKRAMASKFILNLHSNPQALQKTPYTSYDLYWQK